MEDAGWQAGWSYCAAYCEAVWKKAYKNLGAPNSVIKKIAHNLTPSVMTSFNNWDSELIARNPIAGSIFFMQKGRAWKGHAGIVVRSGITHPNLFSLIVFAVLIAISPF